MARCGWERFLQRSIAVTSMRQFTAAALQATPAPYCPVICALRQVSMTIYKAYSPIAAAFLKQKAHTQEFNLILQNWSLSPKTREHCRFISF